MIVPEGHLSEQSGGERFPPFVMLNLVERVDLNARPPAGVVLAVCQLLGAAALDVGVGRREGEVRVLTVRQMSVV